MAYSIVNCMEGLGPVSARTGCQVKINARRMSPKVTPLANRNLRLCPS